VVNHVVEESNLALLIANDWESEVGVVNLVDILDPAAVGLDGVGRETDELAATLGELRLKLGEGTELSGADWSVICEEGERLAAVLKS
jgi:hypothetical protein